MQWSLRCAGRWHSRLRRGRRGLQRGWRHRDCGLARDRFKVAVVISTTARQCEQDNGKNKVSWGQHGRFFTALMKAFIIIVGGSDRFRAKSTPYTRPLMTPISVLRHMAQVRKNDPSHPVNAQTRKHANHFVVFSLHPSFAAAFCHATSTISCGLRYRLRLLL